MHGKKRTESGPALFEKGRNCYKRVETGKSRECGMHYLKKAESWEPALLEMSESGKAVLLGKGVQWEFALIGNCRRWEVCSVKKL